MQRPVALGQRRKRTQQPFGIGVAGIVIDLLRRADLHDASGVHDGHPVSRPRHHAQVVGHQNGGGMQPLLDIPQQIQYLSLHRHVQRRGRLVRQQNFRLACQRHGHQAPLPLTAGQLMGVLHSLLWLHAHQRQQLRHTAVHGGALHAAPMGADSLGDLPAHRHGGIQRRQWILKDHGEHLAPQAAHIPLPVGGNVHSVYGDAAGGDAGVLGQQLHDGAAQHALAAAALPHQRQHLALVEGQAHVPHGLHRPGGCVQAHGEMVDIQ